VAADQEVGEDRASRKFRIAIDDETFALTTATADNADALPRRRYVTSVQLRRLHQQRFSAHVIAAYRRRCAVCRLRHRELLDAAHILPDGHPRGDPVVPNGLSLCKIHHAAFDANIVGVRPDRVVEIRADVLREADGPMLLHGLQGFHNKPLWLPRHAHQLPDGERLEERYEQFRRVG
jgi:putative restriction endonuclease